MKNALLILCLFSIFISGCSSVIDIPKAEKIPIPPTESQEVLIKQGVAAYNKGDYDNALQYYQKVLAENPENVPALYETALTYAAKNECVKSNEYCQRGLVYNSELLGELYGIMGNNYDNLKESDKSIACYEHALSLKPDSYMLHYNLGITYFNAGKSGDAKESLKKALTLNPSHPGSHQALGVIFINEGNKIPALFAICRYFSLENNTRRAENMRRYLNAIISGGVTKSGGKINISVNRDEMKESNEGDFSNANFFYSLLCAQSVGEAKEGETKADVLGKQLESLIESLVDTQEKKPQNTFFFTCYLPYFKELKEKGFCNVLAQYAYQEKNYDSIKRMKFLEWSQGFGWKK